LVALLGLAVALVLMVIAGQGWWRHWQRPLPRKHSQVPPQPGVLLRGRFFGRHQREGEWRRKMRQRRGGHPNPAAMMTMVEAINTR